MPQFETAQIRQYYDRHTAAFVRFGQGASEGAIHRAVWGPGTTTRQQAFHHVDDRIVALAHDLAPASDTLHVVDLGCGVGASLCYLAERLPMRGTGVTLSAVQARLGADRVAKAGLSDRVACLEADYSDLPAAIKQADLAYAIESFVHGPAPDRFLEQCRRLVRPGGLLVICDDFKRAIDHPEADRALDRFCRGWHINSLLRREDLKALARVSGFTHDTTVDLTPFLELRRGRDRVIGALVRLLDWLPLDQGCFDHLLGGNALQTCLANGWIGYDLAIFRRTS